MSRGDADFAVYDPLAPDVRQLVGRVVARGLSDEMDDRHYPVLDGVDGQMHYVNIGRGDAVEPLPPRRHCRDRSHTESHAVDRTVARSLPQTAAVTVSTSISGTIQPGALPSPRPICVAWKAYGGR